MHKWLGLFTINNQNCQPRQTWPVTNSFSLMRLVGRWDYRAFQPASAVPHLHTQAQTLFIPYTSCVSNHTVLHICTTPRSYMHAWWRKSSHGNKAGFIFASLRQERTEDSNWLWNILRLLIHFMWNRPPRLSLFSKHERNTARYFIS